jgi:hypothetical protein
MAAGRARLGHPDFASRPRPNVFDRLAGPGVRRLRGLEQVQDVLGARGRPASQQPMVGVGECPPAADGGETGIAVLGQDHGSTVRRRAKPREAVVRVKMCAPTGWRLDVTDAASPSDPAALPVAAEAVAELAFEQLYRSDYRRLVALAYGLSGSRTAAEELAQEAFLAAHRRWDEVGAYDDPSAWLRRVMPEGAVGRIAVGGEVEEVQTVTGPEDAPPYYVVTIAGNAVPSAITFVAADGTDLATVSLDL